MIGLQKNSPYKDLFNHWLRKFQQVGALAHLKNDYLGGGNCEEVSGSGSSFEPMDYDNVALLFSILIIGTLLSFLSLIIEIAMKCGVHRQKLRAF